MANNEDLKSLLDLVEHGTKKILENDPYYEYRKTAQWAKEQGLIRDLTPEEIQQRVASNEWRKVNKIIKKNENADTSL